MSDSANQHDCTLFQDITSHQILHKAGVAAGLDDAEVKDWLASDKGGKEVDVEVASAQRNFISGVPNFTIQGKYVLEGAQDSNEFIKVFQEIHSQNL